MNEISRLLALDRRNAAVACVSVRRDLGAEIVTVLATVAACALIVAAVFAWFFLRAYFTNNE